MLLNSSTHYLKIFHFRMSSLKQSGLLIIIKPQLSSKVSMFCMIHGKWVSLVAKIVKNLPAMQETWVWSLDWEDPLEKGTGDPLQYSCLENSMDRGVWCAAVHGVARSRIRLSDSHTHRKRIHKGLLYTKAHGKALVQNGWAASWT